VPQTPQPSRAPSRHLFAVPSRLASDPQSSPRTLVHTCHRHVDNRVTLDHIVTSIADGGLEAKGRPSSSTGPSSAAGKGAGADDDPRTARKEKVLHARIPEALDREIKGRARNLGLSVSTIVRHVLMHTFDLVEDIVNDSTNAALSITSDPSRRAAPAGTAPEAASAPGIEHGIIGWQRVVLQRNAVCERCNTILNRGKGAAIAVREAPGPPTIICERCLAAAATDDGDLGDGQ